MPKLLAKHLVGVTPSLKRPFLSTFRHINTSILNLENFILNTLKKHKLTRSSTIANHRIFLFKSHNLKFNFQAAAAAAAAAATGDQSRYVKLDWDILGAALESIGGLDPNHPTSVEVVSAEGESQQIIIQVYMLTLQS